MKKKILVITLAMALVMTSACGSKGDSKVTKEKDETTTEAADVSEDESTTTTPKEIETTTEATTESTTESTTEESAAPTETTEKEESEVVFDLSQMTAEEIADLCDSLTTRKVPQIGDKLTDVQATYFDIEPNRHTGQAQLEARYSRVKKDNVNVIIISGVFCDNKDISEQRVNGIGNFGTGLVIDIYDRAKAEEFIRIMKERHPVLVEKGNGSWKAEDFVVGITAIDYITWDNGVHFQIAYGEKSVWYESVANVFGFSNEITINTPSETSA